MLKALIRKLSRVVLLLPGRSDPTVTPKADDPARRERDDPGRKDAPDDTENTYPLW